MARDLSKMIPRLIRFDFWKDFLDTSADELDNVKTELIEPLLTHYDKWSITDADRLIEISQMLGYTIDTTLDSTADHAVRDLDSVPFRLSKKTTYDSYYHIFDFMPDNGYIGQVFIGYWTTVALFRAFSETLIDSILTHDEQTPYELLPELNYAEFTEGFITLDSGFILDDININWTLDFQLTRLATKHLFVEFTCHEILVEDSTDYNMLNSYLVYLFNAVQVNRKVVEVPRIGVQITALCDDSGYYDNSYVSFNAYTIDDIQLLSSIINPAYTTDPFPTRIAIGIGSQAMESAHSGGTNPTALDDQISIQDIDFVNNQFQVTGPPIWDLALDVFQGNTVKERLLDVGDGIDDTFGGILEHFPVIPGTFSLTYESAPDIFIVSDSQSDGLLIGDEAVGTIDYTTGAWALVTKKNLPIDDELIASGTQTTIVAHFLGNQNIVPGSFIIHYWSGSTEYFTTDDGIGGISGTGISAGTINYVTGQIDLTFSPATDGGKDIDCDYYYEKSSIPDNLTDITAVQYQVTKNLDITEAGLFNAAGDLIAYSTFAPIQLRNTDFHVSMQFFIKQGSF